MAITIKMKDGKYRVNVFEELWEFPDDKEFHRVLNELLECKERYGRNLDLKNNKEFS